MELKEAVQFMVENGYMTTTKQGKYCVTAKFNKAILGVDAGAVPLPNNAGLVVREPMLPEKVINWEQLYMKFILEAQVPARLSGSGGEWYEVNKYSAPGLKGFRRAMEKDRVNYPLLVKSTMLYYKNSSGFKVKIERYMQEDLWRSDYAALLASAENDTVDEHVKQQTTSNEWSRYKHE